MVEPGGEEARPLLDSAHNDCPQRKALPALCDPRRLAHRLLVLAFMCFLGFGSYFCYDNPAALQTQVQRVIDLGTIFLFNDFLLLK
uniref:Uncharacterized protein n=1 Tax=Terrapene triunguis TaxID=2587831 RepID=A0A674INW0_9SAUR